MFSSFTFGWPLDTKLETIICYIGPPFLVSHLVFSTNIDNFIVWHAIECIIDNKLLILAHIRHTNEFSICDSD